MVRQRGFVLLQKQAKFMNYLTVVNKRYKRGFLRPVLDPDEVGKIPEYPPVKPILPRHEQLRIEWRDKILAQETPSDFMYHIWKVNDWCFLLRPVHYHLGSLDFYKHATKTLVVDKLPDEILSRTDEETVQREVESLRDEVKDLLLQQHFHYTHKNDRTREPLYTAKRLTGNLASLMFNSQRKNSHLRDADINYDVDIKSHWVRGKQKFIYDSPVNAHISTKTPLRQFTPLDSELSIGDVASWDYRPVNISVYDRHRNPEFFPGFKLGNPFNCSHTQFFSCTMDRERCLKKKNTITDVFIGQGIASSFGMLSAIAAYNMKFCHRDLETPLSNQMIVFDGQRLSFFCYQLNTLAIDETNYENNSKRNICWHMQDVLLYSDIKDGIVRDFNDEALRLLVAFMRSPTVVAADTLDSVSLQEAVSSS